MIKKFLIILFITTTACSLKPKSPLPLSPEDQRIRAVIFSVNSKIWGDYGRTNKGNFSDFTGTDYAKQLAKSKGSRAQDMRDLMPLFTSKDISTHPETFVFCGFSPRLGIAFCDDAACQGTEFFVRSSTPEPIDTWKEKLPLKNCSDLLSEQ